MASIKVIFRASSPKGHEGTLYFRIIHKRIVHQIHTDNHISRDEWNETESSIIISGASSRQEYLKAVQKKLDDNKGRLERIVSTLDHSSKEYTARDVAEQYLKSDKVAGFISFAYKIMEEDKEMGKTSALEHNSSALNSFIRFHGEGELSFDEFDSKLMTAYECHLKSLGLTPNSTSFYMRKLRAIYNLAVERELTPQRYPFKHVYTGMAKTRKRAVSIDIIKSLRNLDLRQTPSLELARDMFLLSFYTRGMSFVDMAFLKKSNLLNGILSYRRQKTGQPLYIRWENRMQEIVKRYDIPDSDYLLPLIKSDSANARRQYQNASHMINKHLKKLGVKIGMTEPLTMYCARHAWASIAHDNDVPISVISQGMGHDSEKTTRIYLASLDTSVVDIANNKIMNLLDK